MDIKQINNTPPHSEYKNPCDILNQSTSQQVSFILISYMVDGSVIGILKQGRLTTKINCYCTFCLLYPRKHSVVYTGMYIIVNCIYLVPTNIILFKKAIITNQNSLALKSIVKSYSQRNCLIPYGI